MSQDKGLVDVYIRNTSCRYFMLVKSFVKTLKENRKLFLDFKNILKTIIFRMPRDIFHFFYEFSFQFLVFHLLILFELCDATLIC